MSDEKQPLVDNYTTQKFVTVNEARKDRGLDTLKNPDGTPNEDGNLTVAQFEEKQYAARRAAQGYGAQPSTVIPQTSPSASGQRLPFKNMR